MSSDYSYANLDVIDRAGQKVGVVSDVVSDADTFQPTWLVVDVGVLHSSHYVPADVAERNADGQLVVPFDKELVKTATKPNRDHVLTPEEIDDLRIHYQMS